MFLDRLFGGSRAPVLTKEQQANAAMSQIVVGTISEGIATLDSEGIIRMFNQAAGDLTGWTGDKAVNLDYRSVFKLINNAGRPIDDTLNPIMQCYKTRQAANADHVYLETASNRRVEITLKATPIIVTATDEETGKPYQTVGGAVLVFRDITRERAEQNAQTDFISTASHEMRTPVATIRGYMDIILNPRICTIDNRARSYATKALEATEHLSDLFHDLLDVTKADDDRMDLKYELIDATEAAREVTDSYRQRAAKKGLQLVFLPDTAVSNNTTAGQAAAGSNRVVTPPIIISVDLDRFNEALGNIVENAIKYTKHGSVTVNVTKREGVAHIDVKDTGIGIPAEEVGHLFQKFYRVDNRETREIGGTGLGLYLIKKITIAMGGNVGVTSEYGKGSDFWLEFKALTRTEAIEQAQRIKKEQEAEAADQPTSAKQPEASNNA